MQANYVKFFKDCSFVLDIACGEGFFLELLKQSGIKAMGVDSDSQTVKELQKRDYNVVESDIFDFLTTDEQVFDGIFCSHFIEHLDFDNVLKLIALSKEHLKRNGVFVLVFPNSESIRDQLFGFWKDPQHKRYYHSELISTMLEQFGFEIEFSNASDSNLQIPPLDLTRNSSEGKSEKPPSLKAVLKNRIKKVIHRYSGANELRNEFRSEIVQLKEQVNLLTRLLNKIWAHPDEIVIAARKK